MMDGFGNFLKDVKKIDKDSLIKKSNLEFISSNIPNLDYIMGQGFPKYRVVEIFGNESGGKTALATHFSKRFMEEGERVLYVDFENAFNPPYAKNVLGLDFDDEKFILATPDSAEKTFDIIDKYLDNKVGGLIVIDSVASLTTESEKEGTAAEAAIASLPRLMSRGLKRIIGRLEKTGTSLLLLNQMRANIAMYGAAKTTSGGAAAKYYSSIRIDVKRADYVGVYNNAQGIKMKLLVVKNKMAPPFRETILSLHFENGFTVELIDFMIAKGIVSKKGSWFSWGEKLVEFFPDTEVPNVEPTQGKEKFEKTIKDDHPEFYKQLVDLL